MENIFKVLRVHNWEKRILYPAILFFKRQNKINVQNLELRGAHWKKYKRIYYNKNKAEPKSNKWDWERKDKHARSYEII